MSLAKDIIYKLPINIFNLSQTKFRGQRCYPDGELENKWVEGDLIRRDSRFGGANHYIYVRAVDEEDSDKEYLVHAATIELILDNKVYKQK